MRLLIMLGIGYLCYRGLRSWLLKNQTFGKVPAGKNPTEIDDVMIKDPFCEVYFPQRSGVHLSVDGQELHFCSVACRDGFLESHKTDKA